MEERKKLKKEHYRKNHLVSYKNGYVDFSPESMKDVKNGVCVCNPMKEKKQENK